MVGMSTKACPAATPDDGDDMHEARSVRSGFRLVANFIGREQ